MEPVVTNLLTRHPRSLLSGLLAFAVVTLGLPTHASAFPGRGGPPARTPGPTCGGTTIYKSNGSAWTCTFDDEFNATSLDTSLWAPVLTSSAGYHSGAECFVNSPNNISESGGYLNLTARAEAAPFTCSSPYGSYTTQYTSGSVTTGGKFSQTYGRFEVRAAFPAATVAGLQSSLWLYPNNGTKYGAWPTSGEIDIAEAYSLYPDQVIPYIHYTPAAPDPNVTNDNCLISPASFHSYVVEWTASAMTVSFDGTTCLVDTWNPAAPLAAPQPFDQPFYLALTQALGIGTNAFDPATTTLPATTLVDYVRVWK
jgi:beta-glucanase (GH16 family)